MTHSVGVSLTRDGGAPQGSGAHVGLVVPDVVFVVVSGLLSAFGIIWLAWWSRYGLDVTDEGYYLNWIAHPGDYASGVSLFGYAYHPLYVLLNGDIHLLRLANVAITWGLSFAAGWVVLGTEALAGASAVATRWARFSYSSAVATLSLLQFTLWLLTPNYNTLTYQAIVLACIGVVMGLYRGGRVAVLGWVLVSCGGWVAFMAKPTSAAVLALLIALLFVVEWKRVVPALPVAIGSLAAAAGLTVVASGLSPTNLADVLGRGAEIAAALGGHPVSALLRVDQIIVPPGDVRMVMLLALFTVPLTIALAWRDTRTTRLVHAAALTLLVVSFVVAIGRVVDGLLLATSDSIVVFLLIPAILVLLWFPRRGSAEGSFLRLASRVVFFLLLPFAYTFGTNNNQWTTASRAGFFLAMAALCALLLGSSGGRSRRHVQPLLVASQVITGLLLVSVVVHPYRQDDLRTATHPAVVTHGSDTSRINVSMDTLQLLDQAKRATEANGLDRSVGIIDLTGESPGIIYVLGGRPLGQAWLLGGYPGSDEATRFALEDVECPALQHAFILVKRDGPRSVSPSVVQHVGLAFPDAYEVVAEMATPKLGSLVLYRPLDPDQAVTNCRT